MDKIAVLIPCYNEEKTVQDIVKDFKKTLPEAKVYVYDNNSTDNTYMLAKEVGAIVKKEHKQGKGNVVRTMFSEINAEKYILTDGDNAFRALDSIPMLKKIDDGFDIVIGDRLSSTYYKENKRRFHGFGNKLVKKMINVFFKSNIPDIMTGYRAFSYRFVKTYPILSRGFEIETEMTLHAIDKNMNISTQIVSFEERPAGNPSKLNTCSDGIKVIFTILRNYINYHPLSFFGILSFILICISVLLFIPVFSTYLKIGLVPQFPTLIVCGFIALAALLSFFSGLILSNIRMNERRNFELNLIRVTNEQKNKK